MQRNAEKAVGREAATREASQPAQRERRQSLCRKKKEERKINEAVDVCCW